MRFILIAFDTWIFYGDIFNQVFEVTVQKYNVLIVQILVMMKKVG